MFTIGFYVFLYCSLIVTGLSIFTMFKVTEKEMSKSHENHIERLINKYSLEE